MKSVAIMESVNSGLTHRARNYEESGNQKDVRERSKTREKSSTIALERRRVRDSRYCEEDVSEKEPPIQFAIFLLILAVVLTSFALLVNYARTSGWFDNLGRS